MPDNTHGLLWKGESCHIVDRAHGMHALEPMIPRPSVIGSLTLLRADSRLGLDRIIGQSYPTNLAQATPIILLTSAALSRRGPPPADADLNLITRRQPRPRTSSVANSPAPPKPFISILGTSSTNEAVRQATVQTLRTVLTSVAVLFSTLFLIILSPSTHEWRGHCNHAALWKTIVTQSSPYAATAHNERRYVSFRPCDVTSQSATSEHPWGPEP